VKKFADHFSRVSKEYAEFRPQYPAVLFDWIAAQCRMRERAWDCACGSGQATLALAERFAQVIATDASADQVTAAPAHPRVTYGVAPAEASGIASESVDLIAVAQALHWFDLGRFYGEARRVARAGAVLAAWTYDIMRIEDEAIDALVQRFYGETLAPYWPAERRHVESGYRMLDFPGPEIAAPSFEMRAQWPLSRILGMLGSWSAVGRYAQVHGANPVTELTPALSELWGEPARQRTIRWPLTLRAARLRP
jgi:SAM-dependent methyltransferase